MKKSTFLFLFSCMLSLVVSAQNAPQWLINLQDQNKDIIDSINYYNQDPVASEYTTYIIYFHQPLSHANPQGPQFKMRAQLTVDNRQDPTKVVNHVFIGGYGLDQAFLLRPDSTYKASNDCTWEIAHRYNGNFIVLEHRYFAYSSPSECWAKLDYCNSSEAADDFHAIIAAFKKVLTGKWAISGVSKGGITTALQQLYHPEDADIFVPYSAPFFHTDRDTVMQTYWYNNGLTKDYRDLFMSIRRQALADQDHIYAIYQKMNAGKNPTKAHLDTIYGYYLAAVMQFGSEEHAYSDTATIRAQIAVNDSIAAAYNQVLSGGGYTDTVFAFMIEAMSLSLNKFPVWMDTLRCYPDPKQAPNRVLRKKSIVPFGVTKKEWEDEKASAAYYYQAQCELGFYDCRFNDIVSEEQVPNWNKYWKEHYTCLQHLIHPAFKAQPFKADVYNRVTSATKNATKPMIFLYGADDTWTGAAMKDEFINGTNVHKFILPEQNHGVSFNSTTSKTQTDEIKRLLDEVLGAPQAIDQISNLQSPISNKVLRNGQLLIEKNGKTYNVMGMEVH